MGPRWEIFNVSMIFVNVVIATTEFHLGLPLPAIVNYSAAVIFFVVLVFTRA